MAVHGTLSLLALFGVSVETVQDVLSNIARFAKLLRLRIMDRGFINAVAPRCTVKRGSIFLEKIEFSSRWALP